MFLSLKTKYTKIKPEGDEIKIAMKKVSDGRPHYYRIALSEKEIKFFVLMSDDGIVRVAFDACDVCYPEKRGYRQDGDFMICNNCGQSFHETKINIIKGGCNPAPVDRIFDNQFVYVSIDSLQQGTSYF
jgi:uncharacterized membrane protein